MMDTDAMADISVDVVSGVCIKRRRRRKGKMGYVRGPAQVLKGRI